MVSNMDRNLFADFEIFRGISFPSPRNLKTTKPEICESLAHAVYQTAREDPHFSGGVSRRKWGMKALWLQVPYNFKHYYKFQVHFRLTNTINPTISIAC